MSPISATTTTNAASCSPDLSLTCSYCTQTVEKVSFCAACHFEKYCGKECQTKHWPSHKPLCKLIKKQSCVWSSLNPTSIPNPMTSCYPGRFPVSLEQLIPDGKGKLVLDIGSAASHTSLLLLKKGWRVIALDYYKEPLLGLEKNIAQVNNEWLKSGQLTTVQVDVADYVFPDNVGLIVAKDVLPYTDPNKLGALWNKMYNSLVDGGMLIGSFFEKGSPCVAMHGAWTVDSEQSIRSILKRGSYKVLSCERRKKQTYSFTIDFALRKSPAKPQEASPDKKQK